MLDDFASLEVSRALHSSLSRAHELGLLHAADVAPPGAALTGSQSVHHRSDCIAWVDVRASEAGWSALRDVVAQVDDLIRALTRAAPDLGGEGAIIAP